MKRKYRWTLLLMLLFLIGCEAPSADQIKMTLASGIDTVEVHSEFVDAGAKATVYGWPLSVEVIENTVDVTQIGMYRIVYRAEYRGVEQIVLRIVFVVDETPPTGSLNEGVDTVLRGTEWIDAGMNAVDNSQGLVQIAVSGVVDVQTVGAYAVTYTLTDESGNVSSYVRIVYVVDGYGE